MQWLGPGHLVCYGQDYSRLRCHLTFGQVFDAYAHARMHDVASRQQCST